MVKKYGYRNYKKVPDENGRYVICFGLCLYYLAISSILMVIIEDMMQVLL